MRRVNFVGYGVKAVLPVTVLLLVLSGAARAESDANPMAARLSAERGGDVEGGLYSAGDDRFLLEPYNDKYLLRFEGSNENFVLTVERGSLGARVLKYDTGATALRVSIWGGLTLYTSEAPGGVPATRQGDAPPPALAPVSVPDLTAALTDEAGHLAYIQNVALHFSADPNVLAADGVTRAVAFETLVNAVSGIELFLTMPSGRAAFTRRINAVKVTEGSHPGLTIAGQNLLVSFVPGTGYEGRASSHAVAHDLAKLLVVRQ
jgi:hypothetical protein